MRGFATALGKYVITCNAVAPGMILTDVTRHNGEQSGPASSSRRACRWAASVPQRDVGHAVVFHASPEAGYILGKRGMDGVLRVPAREIGGHGITVNQVAPGWTISENRPEPESTQWYRGQVPLRRRISGWSARDVWQDQFFGV